MNSQGRKTHIDALGVEGGGAASAAAGTISGNRALMLEEPLIFEQDSPGTTGVDLPEPPAVKSRLGQVRERGRIGLPGLSEPEVIRHYTRLSQKNYAIDSGLYPLGSCTMKHNPRLNEKLARLPGFSDIHPLQPERTVQGALELIDTLAHWLKTLTGMPAVAMSPAAGAHGELCGMMSIRAAIEDRDGGTSQRRRVLVPESAHGTNPATAAACGFTVDAIPADATGRVDVAALKAKLGDDVAAIMLTNPNTCGLFERDIVEIAEAVHAAGAYFYCDGANFNAIVGRVRPGDLGVDAMHINLHKTFSTPHGGGGPGAGPVVLSEALAPFAPAPWVVNTGDGYKLVEREEDEAEQAFGRLCAFQGQMGMYVRALSYMMSHGSDGLRQVAEDAVLVGAGPLLWLLAAQMVDAGCPPRAVVENLPRGRMCAALPHLPGALRARSYFLKGLALMRKVKRAGVPIHRHASGLSIEGFDAVRALTFSAAGRSQRIDTTSIALHQGVVPNQQVTRLMRADHRWDASQHCFRPVLDTMGQASVPGLYVAGEGAGIAGAKAGRPPGPAGGTGDRRRRAPAWIGCAPR